MVVAERLKADDGGREREHGARPWRGNMATVAERERGGARGSMSTVRVWGTLWGGWWRPVEAKVAWRQRRKAA